MMKVFSFGCVMLVIAGASWGQPATLIFSETDLIWTCPCESGQDAEIIAALLMEDRAPFGPSIADTVAGQSAVDCSQPGICRGRFDIESEPHTRYYVWIERNDCCWNSGSFYVQPGAQEIELSNWMCSTDCYPPPLQSIRFVWPGPPFRCPCGTGDLFPGGWEVEILSDLNQNGPDLSDSLVGIGYFGCNIGLDSCRVTWPQVVPGTSPVYLRSLYQGCCYFSSLVDIPAGAERVEIPPWRCSNTGCQNLNSFEFSITFDGCLQNLGCPCERLLQFPEGTAVHLMDRDESIASFAFASGSGLPPWNCQWTPFPNSRPRNAFYHVSIEVLGCCWESVGFNLSDTTNIITISQTDWACSRDCNGFYELTAPRDFAGECHDSLVTLSWRGSGLEQWFDILTGEWEYLALVSGNVSSYMVAANPRSNGYYISGWNYRAASDFAYCEVPCPVAIAQVEFPHRDRLGPHGVLISPNPFNPATRIVFELPESQHVSLIIYDLRGREVERIVDETLERGGHFREWNASRFPSGVYFAKLALGAEVRVEKLLLLK